MENYWRDFVMGIDEYVPLADGRQAVAVQFDNAATTPPFREVLAEINRFAPWYASVRRGGGYKSDVSTELYENARLMAADFIGADRRRDAVIFTKNATEGINMLAHALAEEAGGSVILTTEMEHFANDLPWREAFSVDYIKALKTGEIDLDDYQKKLAYYGGRVRLVAVTGASNVTGFCPPIHKMAAMAHGYGAEFMADGAQLIPHKGFSMRPHEDGGHIDYVVFSAHKMYAPFGCGVLAGKARLFRRTLPFLKGGGTINLAGRTFIDWESVPHKNEAGTPNLIGALALVKAMEILARVGLDNVHAAENQLADYIYDGLKRESGVFVYGGARQKNAVSIVSFNIEGMHHRQVSRILSAEYGISVRSGMFCAHPYVTKLLKISEAELKEMAARKLKFLPGMVRVSLGVYNTKSEADKLLAAVNTIVCRKKDYLKEYRLPNGEFLLP